MVTRRSRRPRSAKCTGAYRTMRRPPGARPAPVACGANSLKPGGVFATARRATPMPCGVGARSLVSQDAAVCPCSGMSPHTSRPRALVRVPALLLLTSVGAVCADHVHATAFHRRRHRRHHHHHRRHRGRRRLPCRRCHRRRRQPPFLASRLQPPLPPSRRHVYGCGRLHFRCRLPPIAVATAAVGAATIALVLCCRLQLRHLAWRPSLHRVLCRST